MTHGRTVWWAKDSGWWRREGIVELAEEFGTDGPAVLDWLCCEADDGGRVSATVDVIARGAFVAATTVERVLVRAIEVGELERQAAGGFRLVDYRAASPRGPLPPAVRALVMARDDFACRRCGWRPQATLRGYDGSYAPRDGDRWLEVDHVVPLARGGNDDEANMQVLCAPCNRSKGPRR